MTARFEPSAEHDLIAAIRRAARQEQDGVQVAVFAQDLEHLAGLVREQAVVRQYHRRPATRLQHRQDVLDEVQLLVARRNREVVAVGVEIDQADAAPLVNRTCGPAPATPRSAPKPPPSAAKRPTPGSSFTWPDPLDRG